MSLVETIKNEDKFILFIYAYVFLMPWNFFKGQMGALTVILFIWWLIKFRGVLIIKLKEVLEFKPLVILVIFILYTYISVLWSDPISDGLKHVNQFTKYYFFLIPILFTSLNKEQAFNSIKLFIISFGSYAVFSFMIYLGLFTIESTGSKSSNPKGIMAYAIMSTYLAISAIGAFIIAQYQNTKKLKVLFYMISFISLISLFINNSRTAQVALILTIITLIIFSLKNISFKDKKLYIGFAIIIIFLGIVFVTLQLKNTHNNKYLNAYNELQEIVNENKYEGSFSLRVYFYKAGFEIIKNNLIFGMGPEDNIKKLREIQKNDPVYTKDNYYSSFHSQHLDILTRYGLIGYLLLLISVVFLLYKLRENKKIFYLATSFMLVVFYTSLANVMLIKKPFNYIFISVFVLFSIIAYYKQKEEGTSNS